MASTPRDPDDTITELYRAAAGTEGWPRALQRVVDDLDGLGAQFIGIDKKTNGIIFSHASETTPAEGPLEYVRTYHAVDPRIPLLAQKPVGEWLFCQDHFDDAFAASNPYYRDLLIPYGGRYSASCKIAENDHEVIMIAFLGKGTNPPFSAEQRDYFRRMGRHLQEALTLYQRLRGIARAGAVGASLIARLRRPVAVIDSARTLGAANEPFEALVAQGELFQLEQRRVRAIDSELERALAAAITELSGVQGSTPRARIVRLKSQSPKYLALSLAVVVPEETLHAFGETTQYLMTVHERPTAPHHDVSLWQAAFNLSPAEARVAAHLFGGKPPKEIAKALHVSPSTIKTHLDALFSKTGTSRQAELVRVLGMVVE